ncbi:hypothetical protein ES702_03442 [subsurface metagenome]
MENENENENDNENENENDWLSDYTTMDVGGNFLIIHNAFKYIFTIDLSKKPDEVKKQYEGEDAGTKFQWHIILFNFEVMSKNKEKNLKKQKPEKYEKIMDMELNENYILELPKGATKNLAIFLKANKYHNNTLITMTRSGTEFDTKYYFEIATENDIKIN